jgi:hypothetical protein
MMYEVMEQLIPEHLTDRELAAIEEGHGTIELMALEGAKAPYSLFVHATISRSEEADLARALEIGGLVLEAEASFDYAEGQARIDLAEMPRELADRAAFGIRAEIILLDWKRLEEPDRILGLGVPDRPKGVHFVGVGHGQSPSDGRGNAA